MDATGEELVFAVGDIHGRLDLVRAAVDAIVERAGSRPFRIIFLGDYVDRGPDSLGVVELMMELTRDSRFVCLKGNHEAMMVRAMTDGNSTDFRVWMDAGGDATLASYGADDWESARVLIPTAHLRWMTALPLTSGDGHRIYVHAGLMPSTPFDKQTEETCLWVRERFLRASAHQFDNHVVHGHTPYWAGKPTPGEPELLAYRTNLDLGAYMTDRLGVGVFDRAVEGGPIEVFVIAQRDGAPVIVSPLALAGAPRLGGAGGRRGPPKRGGLRIWLR